MAATITVTDSIGTYYYIDSDKVSERLTDAQMDSNASYIWKYVQLNFPSWTIQAVSAMCGNFAHEGIMNPSQWEYGKGMSTAWGYGLGQWTPGSKFLDWASAAGYQRTEISGQIQRVNWESQNNAQWIPTSTYNFSMTTFLTSTEAPAYLASAWLYDWERPGDPASTESIRRASADHYYQLFSGQEPPTPPDPPDPPDPPEPPTKIRSGLKPCYYHRFRYD